MLSWGQVTTLGKNGAERETFEEKLDPDCLDRELKAYQLHFGNGFTLRELLYLKVIRSRVMIAEAIAGSHIGSCFADSRCIGKISFSTENTGRSASLAAARLCWL